MACGFVVGACCARKAIIQRRAREICRAVYLHAIVGDLCQTGRPRISRIRTDESRASAGIQAIRGQFSAGLVRQNDRGGPINSNESAGRAASRRARAAPTPRWTARESPPTATPLARAPRPARRKAGRCIRRKRDTGAGSFVPAPDLQKAESKVAIILPPRPCVTDRGASLAGVSPLPAGRSSPPRRRSSRAGLFPR